MLIHPLTDHRRILPVEKKGELLEAADGFLLVMSYNPGYQSALKDLKHSTRQRFIAIEFGYPPKETEAEIVAHESGVDTEMAMGLAKLGEKVREPQGARSGRGRKHTPADLRREDDIGRHQAATGVPGSGELGRYGRSLLQASVDEVINSNL